MTISLGPRIAAGFLAAALTAGGCTGAIGTDDGDGTSAGPALPENRPARPNGAIAPSARSGDLTAASFVPAPARVRRLTASEIRASARDIFLGGQAITDELPSEFVRHGYDNDFDRLSAPPIVTEALQAFAEKVSAKAVANLPALLPCDPAKDERACAAAFIQSVGLRTYRRPLGPAEIARLQAVFDASRPLLDFPGAIGAVIEAMLQSPNFLYRTELGDPGEAGKPKLRLTPYETASALSYFLVGSAPDTILLEAARTGKLGQARDLEVQARRLLQDARAKDALRSFFLQWLELQELGETRKNTALYPEFTATLAHALAGEMTGYLDHLLWTGDATIASLLTSRTTFADGAIAQIYGLPGPRGTNLVPVMLDGVRRAGILSTAGFLSALSGSGDYSPINVGRFVRTRLLCATLPAPPVDVPPLPDARKAASTREQFGSHSSDPACEGCHRLLDPVGFGFERFDAIGRYREIERGTVPLTGEGHLVATDVDGPFRGPVELASKLVGSAMFRECVARNVLTFALGRAADPSRDGAVIGVLDGKLASTGGNLRELVIAAASSDALVFRDGNALPKGDAR